MATGDVGKDINIKRLKWDPIGEHYSSSRQGDKKIFGQKKADFISEFEIKKVFVGEDINIKRLKWEPIGEHFSSSRHGR